MSTLPSSLPNPFPGLRSFRSDEKHLFFGREDQVGELLQRLRANRFLAVVGPSGSGKSSLVRAGLLPELHGGTMASAGSHWEVLVMRPGGDPLTNLAAAMVEADCYDAVQPGMVDQVRTTLDRSALGLVEAVRQSDLAEGTNTLVVVDQFEEIFRFREQGGQSLEEAAAFVKLLLEASRAESHAIYVVLTMRSDYLGECAQFRGLAEAVNEGEYLIPRLTRQQRRSAIEGPIQVGGAGISKRLLTKLLNDVGDDPDQLPVLQHALMRTWDHWAKDHAEGEPVDLRHYEGTGGMSMALSRHADEVFEALGDDRKRELAERVFRSLTERVDETRGIRRPLRLGMLASVVDVSVEEVKTVVEAYRHRGCTFLMPPETVELKERTVIDISHESLMRIWQRLRHWVDEEAQSAGIYRRLSETAGLHAQGRAGLYHDPDLGIARAWREENHPNAAWAALYGGDFEAAMAFLDRSQEEAERQEKERETARQRELEQARALAASQARAARLLRRFALTVCGALVVAVVLAVWAIRQSRIAEAATTEARIEQGKTWLANAQALNESRDYFGAKLKAARALGFEGFGSADEPGSFQQRYRRLLQPDLPEWTEAASLVRNTPDNIPVWQSGSLPQLEGQINDLAMHPSRPMAAVVGEEEHSVIRIWNTTTGEPITTLEGHQDDVESVAFSPDGAWLASAENESVFLWKVQGQTFTRSEQRSFETSALRTMDFHPDGRRLAVADDNGSIWLWELASGVVTEPVTAHGGARIEDIEFSPDGVIVATAGFNGTVELRDGNTLANRVVLTPEVAHPRAETRGGPQPRLWTVSFSPDGALLVVSGFRRPPTVWDVAARRVVATPLAAVFDRVIRRSAGGIRNDTVTFGSRASAFSPDGKWLMVGWNEEGGNASVAVRSTLSVFDVSGTNRLEPVWVRDIAGHGDSIARIGFTHDGQRVLTGDMEGRLHLWDAARGARVGGAPLAHEGRITAMRFSPDGRLFATGDRVGSIRIWDTLSGRQVSLPEGHSDEVRALCFSLDGHVLYSVGFRDRQLRAWEVETGRKVREVAMGFNLTGVDLSPDGSTLVVGGQWGEMAVLNTADDSAPRSVSVNTAMGKVQFFRDGNHVVGHFGNESQDRYGFRIVELNPDGTAREVGASDDKAHKNHLMSLAGSGDGRFIVTCGWDGVVRLWSVGPDWRVTEQEALMLRDRQGDYAYAAFDPSGRRLLTTEWTSGLARMWNADNGQLLAALQFGAPNPAAVFHPDGSMVLMGGDHGLLQMWSTREPAEPRRIEQAAGTQASATFLRKASLNPSNGRLFITGGSVQHSNAVVEWDIHGPTPVFRREWFATPSIPVNMEFTPDGTRMVSISPVPNSEMVLWKVDQGLTPLQTVPFEEQGFPMAISPDGSILATGHADRRIRLWKIGDTLEPVGEPIQLSTIPMGMAFSADGKRLFLTGMERVIGVWTLDPTTWKASLTGSLRGHTAQVFALALSPDGKRLASGSYDGSARLWDTDTLRPLGPPLPHGSGLMPLPAVAFSPDGTQLATGGRSGSLRLWNGMGTGEMLAIFQEEEAEIGVVRFLSFTQDGTRLIASMTSVASAPSSVSMFDVASVGAVAELPLSPFAGLLDLATASGGLKWTLQATQLTAAGTPRAFVPIAPRFHPFLKGITSDRERRERLFAHYLRSRQYRMAGAVLDGFRDPPADAPQWDQLIHSAALDYAARVTGAEDAGARFMEGQLRMLMERHPGNRLAETVLAAVNQPMDHAREQLLAALATIEPRHQARLMDSFFGIMEARMAKVALQSSGEPDQANAPDTVILLVQALKRLAEQSLSAWPALPPPESTRKLLEEAPEVTLIYEANVHRNTVLVPKGAVWKYFPDHAAPAPEWKEPGFDDSSWPSGPADIGFGTSADRRTLRTQIQRFRGRMTYYFRHRFTLAEPPSAAGTLRLSLQRDDGVVMHLNGTEIHREHMPEGPVDDLTRSAQPPVGDEDEFRFFETTLDSDRLSPLRVGDNTLAIEVHQVNGTSTDVHLDLALVLLREQPIAPEHLGRAVEFFSALASRDNVPDWLRAFAPVTESERGSAGTGKDSAAVWFVRSRVANLLGDVPRESACLERALALTAAGGSQEDEVAHEALVLYRQARVGSSK